MALSRVLVLGLFVSIASVACSNAGDSSPSSNEPADNQDEQEVQTGVTKLAGTLPDPRSLTAVGDNIYFSTTYGYATQEEAEYNHDIWVKEGSGRVKRLYKGLYGASWGSVATKNGIYEINEGYASVIKYPLDGSKKDGDSLYHSTYGNDEQPEVGIIQLAADDDGIVLALRTSDDDSKPASVVALSPAGKNEKKLGEVPGGATALHVEGAKVYVGTKGGEVKVAARDGSGALTKVASGDGAVSSIAISGDDVFFATDKGIFVKRKGAANADKLLGEGAGDLSIARDQLLFGQYKKGLSAIPLAGGQARLLFKIGAPVSTLFANNFVWLLDASLGKCHEEEEGNACPWEGAAFRIKF